MQVNLNGLPLKYPQVPKKIQHNKTQNPISTFLAQIFIVLSRDQIFMTFMWWDWGSKEIVKNLGQMFKMKVSRVHTDIFLAFSFDLFFSKF